MSTSKCMLDTTWEKLQRAGKLDYLQTFTHTANVQLTAYCYFQLGWYTARMGKQLPTAILEAQGDYAQLRALPAMLGFLCYQELIHGVKSDLTR